MNILCLTSSECDYLQDQTLVGLRNLHGTDAIEVPRKDILYTNSATPKRDLYGHGFSTWCTLDDLEINRTHVMKRAAKGEFDTIVFPSIWRTIKAFEELRDLGVLTRKDVRVIFIDGEDHPRLYKPALTIGEYYKRELRRRLWIPKGVHGIGFSIPRVKLRTSPLTKTRTFATHAQCKEAFKIPEVRDQCKESYAFTDESEYYHDIGISKYAFTMKKCGWECMRHYEISANQTVPCFYKLHARPKHCAPYGLIDMKNAVGFKNARELKRKLAYIDEHDLYPALQANAFAWAQEHTCERAAEYILR